MITGVDIYNRFNSNFLCRYQVASAWKQALVGGETKRYWDLVRPGRSATVQLNVNTLLIAYLLFKITDELLQEMMFGV